MVAGGIALAGAQCAPADHALQPTHADRVVVPRFEIPSLRTRGFEDSLTRKGARIEVLLLLSAMAAFATWLVGMACERCGIDAWLTPFRSRRRLYSVMRLGREALVRRWSNTRLSALIDQLRNPSPQLLDQLGVPA